MVIERKSKQRVKKKKSPIVPGRSKRRDRREKPVSPEKALLGRTVKGEGGES